MFNKNEIKRKLTDFFDFPGDVIMNQSRTLILGNMKFYIENHRGIIFYSTQKIRINMPRGELCIHGREFVINRILKEEIVVFGEIESIEFKF